MKLYAICFGVSKTSTMTPTTEAYADIEKICLDKQSAEVALEKCRQDIMADLTDAINNNPEIEDADIYFTGTVKEGYFNISYSTEEELGEIYISIVEKEI